MLPTFPKNRFSVVTLSDFSIISTQKVTSAVSEVTFSEKIDFSEFSSYQVIFSNVSGSADNTSLNTTIRVSTDTEITSGYLSAASRIRSDAASIAAINSTSAASLIMSDAVQALGLPAAGRISIGAPDGATPMLDWTINVRDSSTVIRGYDGVGSNTTTSEVTGITFKFSSGNITSGIFTLVGIR